MINGKPYSQYKAEQDALKNQSKTAAVQTYATSNSGAVNYVAEVNTKPAPVQRTTPETGVNTPKTVTVETKEVVAVQQSSSEPRPGLMANNPAVKTVEPKPVEKRNENPQQESKTSVTQKADVKTDKADVPPTNAVNPLIQTLKLETAPVETKTEEKTTPAPVGNDSKAKTKTD